MKRLKIEDIFIPGAKLELKEIDTNDPEIKRLFDETAKRQQEIKDMRDAPIENIIITI